jgi:hypothetical protein
MLTRGVPQIRQSEGNRTAKRLSAIWPVQLRSTQLRSTQPRSTPTPPVREAIEGLATGALAWLARILSPLLLKTASVLPAENISWAGDSAIACLYSSITAAAPLGNVTIRPRRRSGQLLNRFGKPLFHRHEEQPIVTPEAFRTSHRPQKENRQKITFGKGPAPRTKSRVAAAIVTVEFKVFLEPDLVGGVLGHVTPRNDETSKGRQTDERYSTPKQSNKPIRKTPVR